MHSSPENRFPFAETAFLATSFDKETHIEFIERKALLESF